MLVQPYIIIYAKLTDIDILRRHYAVLAFMMFLNLINYLTNSYRRQLSFR